MQHHEIVWKNRKWRKVRTHRFEFLLPLSSPLPGPGEKTFIGQASEGFLQARKDSPSAWKWFRTLNQRENSLPPEVFESWLPMLLESPYREIPIRRLARLLPDPVKTKDDPDIWLLAGRCALGSHCTIL